jgi:hypothetical protein
MAMKHFVKVALSGKWYAYTQADNEQEVRTDHAELLQRMPDLAMQYPGTYLVQEVSPDNMPPRIRSLIDAIERKDYDAFMAVFLDKGDEHEAQ